MKLNQMLLTAIVCMMKQSPQLTMESGLGNTPVRSQHGTFLQRVLSLVLDAAFAETDRSSPVIRYRSPHQIKQIIPLGLDDVSRTDDELLVYLENIVKFSTKTGHPHFINQLFSGLDPYGLAGQLITDALNPSVYTYEVAPVFTLMENEVLSEMLQLVGFDDGDGIFCPGGSLANGFAINLARFYSFPDIKKRGINHKLVIFASEDAHYSVHKMAAFLGLGEEAVVSVSTDEIGCIDPQVLTSAIDVAIASERTPLLIFATAGTTVLGAFDPIDRLATVAEKYKLWLHVDAAWGGGLLFSQKHRHLLHGIHKANSVTWNPHKLLAVPQQCSTLLVRQKKWLMDCHSRKADYLFQKDKFYDTELDVGDKYLQCGRRADVLKFWLMWKAKGSVGLAAHVDHLMSVSQHLLTKLHNSDRFSIVAKPQFVNVCFWYKPSHLANLDSHPDYLKMLHEVAPRMKEKMLRRGTMMINYQPLRNWPNFFRFVAQNSSLTFSDIDFFVEEIDRIGRSIDFLA